MKLGVGRGSGWVREGMGGVKGGGVSMIKAHLYGIFSILIKIFIYKLI